LAVEDFAGLLEKAEKARGAFIVLPVR